MKKRLFALSLCLVMCLALLPVTALASDTSDLLRQAIEYVRVHQDEIKVSNDSNEDTISRSVHALLKTVMPEDMEIKVSTEIYRRNNASTTAEGFIEANIVLEQDGYKQNWVFSLTIPVAEASQSEVDMIEADMAAIAAAFADYFATAKVDQSNILQQKKNLQKVAEDAVPNSSDVEWVTGSGFSTSMKQGYIRGTLHMVLGAQVRDLELDATINADGSVTMNSPTLNTPTTPTTPAAVEAMPTNDKLTVNGALQTPTVYKINGGNYFKLRDLAVLLNGTSCQFDVGYDAATNSVTADSGKGYVKLDGDMAGPASGNQTATLSNDKIIVNGQVAQVEVYKIGGGNYFKLRDLGNALGFDVGWDDANKVASITTSG